MNDFRIKQLQSTAIGTGLQQIGKPKIDKQIKTEPAVSFQDILNSSAKQDSSVEFTKHAAQRITERNIDISAESMERLNEGVRLAEEKGLNDTLILIDRTAFLVNIKNNKVITTVNGGDLQGNVFTNIDGTVII